MADNTRADDPGYPEFSIKVGLPLDGEDLISTASVADETEIEAKQE
jgi:hypothetical protein